MASIPKINETLSRLLAEPQCAHYCIAFSGGADSTALLHLMAHQREAWQQLRLRAVHVNHHLLPQADDWALHCRRVAAQLQVPLEVRDVQVARGAGISPEAAARESRYQALRDELRREELLLTAHHQEDQLETLLLQLLRGAGVAGLAAMPADAPFGRGRHLRPLLHASRAGLEDYLRQSGIGWIEDPSNALPEFDRNYLRHQVLPALRQRWPNAALTATRTASHLAEAQELLEELARIDLAAVREGEGLSAAALRALTAPRARNLLRYWIRAAGARPPSTVKLQEILRQMLQSRPDATPQVTWEGADVTRRGGVVYLRRL